jgi:hypothetical protein
MKIRSAHLDSMARNLVVGRSLRGVVALALGVAALSGCGAPPSEDAADGQGEPAAAPQTIPNLIASVRLTNGTRVDFHEPEPGQVFAVATGDVPGGVDGPSAVAFYEALANRSAPTELLEAQRRVDEARLHDAPHAAVVPSDAREARLDAPPPELSARNGIGTSVQGLTAAGFQSSYCPSGSFGFYYCWTNRTGDGTITVTSVSSIHAYINAYRGQVMMSVYHRASALFPWSLNVSVNVTGASSVWSWSSTTNGGYKIEVTQASGDGYHESVYGQ